MISEENGKKFGLWQDKINNDNMRFGLRVLDWKSPLQSFTPFYQLYTRFGFDRIF